jgi:ABC-type xylose transport system permease subunit
MLKSIFKGFTSDKSGKLYLISILILIISNIIISVNSNLYLVGTISVIFYVIALVYYSSYMELKLWVTLLLVGVTLVPMGIWITLFYFARKNYYIYHSED